MANTESQSTLHKLAQCSHQLFLCTIPYLYHHLTVQEEIKALEQPTGELRNLATLLLRRSDLARLIRHFTFRLLGHLWMETGPFVESEGSEHSEELEEPEASETHVNLKTVKVDRAFKTAVKASSLSKEENNKLRKLSSTHKRHHGLILALVLPTLLKLEKLVLDLQVICNTQHLEQMVRRVACRERPFDIRPPFEALTVFVHLNERFSAGSMDVIASLLKLSYHQGNLWRLRVHKSGS